MYRARKLIRIQLAEEIKDKLPFVPLNVDWDGKIFKEFTSSGVEKVDRYSITVSSNNNEQLLGVVKCPGTGAAISDAVLEILNQWKISSVVSMSFNTTSSNTGKNKGFFIIKLLKIKNFKKCKFKNIFKNNSYMFANFLNLRTQTIKEIILKIFLKKLNRLLDRRKN